MTRYAANTSVSAERSRMDIEKLLAKHKCEGFGYMQEGDQAVVMFRLPDRINERTLSIRMVLPLPDRDATEFQWTPARRKRRTAEQAYEAWLQACAARWRALLLVIKAKLEAVETGISTIEREFLADVMLGTGQTVGELVSEQREALSAGGTLKLLPAPE